jgi:hypothetical protein
MIIIVDATQPFKGKHIRGDPKIQAYFSGLRTGTAARRSLLRMGIFNLSISLSLA